MHIIIGVLLCVLKGSLLSLDISKVVPNIVSLLREWHSALALGIFSISETKRIKHNTVSIQYISINFDRTFNSKKSHNSLFLSDTKLRARKVLKELLPYINDGFKLFVILPFIIVYDSNLGLLLRIIRWFLRRFAVLIKKLQKQYH